MRVPRLALLGTVLLLSAGLLSCGQPGDEAAGPSSPSSPTPTFTPAPAGRIAATKADLSTIRNALLRYRLDFGHYPTTAEGLAALNKVPADAKGWHGPHSGAMPLTDRWGNPYRYAMPGTGGKDFDLQSDGGDGSGVITDP